MTANLIGDSSVIHPIVVITMGGYKFRALLDSGSNHSYVSSTAIEVIKAKVKSSSFRQIAMLTDVETRTMQVYEIVMRSVIIDANDFAKIRTSGSLRVGRRGDPVA